MLNQLKKELEQITDPIRAKHESRYFKTGKGEYGEGDTFLGIDTLDKRKLAKKYSQLSLKDVEYLISSKFHDYRFVALVILINLKVAKTEILLSHRFLDLANWYRIFLSLSNRCSPIILGADISTRSQLLICLVFFK